MTTLIVMFQFQCGAIRSPDQMEITDKEICFNSSVVRLEV